MTVLDSSLVQVEQESVRLQGVLASPWCSAGVSLLCLCRDKKLPGPASFQPTQCKAAASQPVLQLKYLSSICSFHSANQRGRDSSQKRELLSVVVFWSLSQTSYETAGLASGHSWYAELCDDKGGEVRVMWWPGRVWLMKGSDAHFLSPNINGLP